MVWKAGIGTKIKQQYKDPQYQRLAGVGNVIQSGNVYQKNQEVLTLVINFM